MWLTALLTSLAFLVACSNSDNPTNSGSDPGAGSVALYDAMVRNLPADPYGTGAFTYFSLRNNAIVDSTSAQSSQWDLAFKSTSILTNSGISGPGQGGD